MPRSNVLSLLAQAPTAFVPWVRYGGVLLNDLVLDPGLRELAILQVGRLAQRYEWEQHLPFARAAGVAEQQIAALERGETDHPVFDPVQRAVLGFVADLTLRDGQVGEADYAALAALLPERQIVELALVTAHYVGVARLMTALRIDSDQVPMGPEAVGRGLDGLEDAAAS
ncbi:carboxymuconolactone decarboxylase family protein [Streptomyces sp. NPDC056296]|uniref:carboxymuconolactone decarboxylase family protein n=1 Tax=Streptomyces sp. NPDC056296 TaxID=3345775 RepID=UPI0035E1A644